ncbi:MAG TPA: multicopper oxidase family protein [Gaiellaceae bacterium]|nr:multicopper oxidase family protein [Gaiellaceae bacterium]
MNHHDDTTLEFPRDLVGLPPAVSSELVDLADGDRFGLRIAPVAKRVGADTVRMIAYNGSVPGPALRVRQGSEVVVDVLNDGDLEATVHWHGLRLENRYDGAHETQTPIPVGRSFPYRISFPDPGVYWYHPHIREDYGQELGQYGNIVVVPTEADYWPPVHRELLVTLDDVLIEDGKIAPFSRDETTFAAMGRYGNVLLAGGEVEPSFAVQRGEVVRLYPTNTANTRVFDVALPGARMKLVGGDSGRVEREELVESVVIAPSERVIVDVLFEQPGALTLQHRTPDTTYTLATIDVGDEPAVPALAEPFDVLRENPEWATERERLSEYVAAAPDKRLAFVAEMDMATSDGPVTYACPMHPEVVSDTADRCPECGMKLVDAALVGASAHADHGHDHDHSGHVAHDSHGIEWEDDMVEVNRLTTPANMRWKLVDLDSGAENHGIDWTFTVGDRVKLRLVNEMDSDHPMHHPFHVHGAGRFVILSRDGVPESNLVWKDTVLVRTGETVDILLDVTNPGRWMAHCHIAEHHESGMMFSFDVAPARVGA